MVRSRRTKIAPEVTLRVVLSVLAGEMSARETAPTADPTVDKQRTVHNPAAMLNAQ
jgi:hypothetical protein